MILELSLESVFAVVDMYFVSHLPDNEIAIATVGLTESVIAIIYTLAIGLEHRRHGSDWREKSLKLLPMPAHSLFFTGCCCIAEYYRCHFAPEILRLMKAEERVVQEGAVFTRIMLGGSMVIVLLFWINGIFRGPW